MNVAIRIALSVFFIIGYALSHGWAQRFDPLSPPIGSTQRDSVPPGIMPLDTPVPMTYVLIGDPQKKYVVAGSRETYDDPYMPLPFYHAHLGNYGSATRSLAPEGDGTLGYSSGWFQYNPYYQHEGQFRYYDQDIPVSKIRFTQAGQEDTWLTLDFGRSFARGLNLSIAYNRIHQIGEFAHQRQKNTGLGIGVWHHAPSGKYDAFYNFISNAAIAQENGGITSTSFFEEDLYPDAEIPTFLNAGLTEHKQRIFVTRQILHLAGDTSQIGIDLWLKGKWATGLYKYADRSAASFTEYYGTTFLVDDRGIRQYTYDREHQWSFGVTLPWKAAHSTVEASLRYRNIRVDQEPVTKKIDELYLDASGQFQWIEPLTLRGELSLGLGQADGAVSFKATGDLKTGILGHLKGHWSLLTRLPYLVESSLYVMQQQIYAANWRNPLVNEVGVTWEIEKQAFQAGVRWIVFDNYIYFDSVPLPRQLEESISIRRFFLSKTFDLKWVTLKGHVIWQPDVRNELAVPELLYSAGVYGKIHLFEKRVTLVPDLNFTHHGAYAGSSYFPVNGVYHLTYGSSIPEYFRVDVGLSLQVRFLKAFVRMEDIVGAFKNRVLYQAELYPHYRGYFRIGLEAGFFN